MHKDTTHWKTTIATIETLISVLKITDNVCLYFYNHITYLPKRKIEKISHTVRVVVHYILIVA